jgi:hypothetical protein
VFVGHGGDESDRLLVVDRDGLIKVLQQGATSPAVFRALPSFWSFLA